MQLWNKQKTSVFANSWRRSRVILIEKHFKPICIKIASTTPFSDDSKAMIREMDNVELFVETQHIVIHNSKLAGPRRSASQWINWHRKTTPIANPMRSMRDIKKTLVSHTEQIGQECTDETPIRLPNRSHINEPSPPRIRKNVQNQSLFSSTKDGTRFLPVLHGGVGTKTGGAHNLFISPKILMLVGSMTTDSNLLQPTGCVNSTSRTSPFSRSQRALAMMCHTTLAEVFLRVIPSMCHAPEWLSVLSSILTLLSSLSLTVFQIFFLNLGFHLLLFHVDVLGARSPVHFAQMKSLSLWPITLLSQVYEPNFFDDFHYSETTEIFLQKQSSNTNALVLAWRGDQWRYHRQSALFTTVHSEARRNSGPKTSLSLSWGGRGGCCQVSRCLSVM